MSDLFHRRRVVNHWRIPEEPVCFFQCNSPMAREEMHRGWCEQGGLMQEVVPDHHQMTKDSGSGFGKISCDRWFSREGSKVVEVGFPSCCVIPIGDFYDLSCER